MLPDNALGKVMYRKLHVYAGPSHPHAGQVTPGGQQESGTNKEQSE
jgi:ribosomal protein L13